MIELTKIDKHGKFADVFFVGKLNLRGKCILWDTLRQKEIMELKVTIDGIKVNDKTNILDVDVPDWLKVRISSGISWLDELLGGGFLATQAIMLTGDPGAGKTTLSLQLADAITASGNICVYNSREESLAQVRAKIEGLGLQNGFMVTPGYIFASDLLEHVNRVRSANPKKHVFLVQDSLPALDDGKYRGKKKKNAGGNVNWGVSCINSSTPARSMQMLTNWAKETHGTVVCINHVTKSGQYAGKGEVKHMIDTHMEMDLARDNSRSVYVSKNRFGTTADRYIISMTSAGLQLAAKEGVQVSVDEPANDVEEDVKPKRKRKLKNG